MQFRGLAVVFVLLLLLLLPLVGHSYFEDRYRCTLQQQSIDVSLSTGQQMCFTYLAGIGELIQKTDADIEQARKNYTADKDTAYRSGVLLQLHKEHTALVQTQQDVLLAVKDFEQELFVRVKRLVGYYLKPNYDILTDKLDQAQVLQNRLLVLGNTEQFAFVRIQMDRRQREIMFLERIRDAGTFEQLIPLLKRRFEVQKGDREF